MANSNSNRTLVPEAKDSLNQFKYEVASDMCVKNIFTYLLATSSRILCLNSSVRLRLPPPLLKEASLGSLI